MCLNPAHNHASPPLPEGLDVARQRVIDRLIELDRVATWSALNRPEYKPLREALDEYARLASREEQG
jgi:hypothetical protein